MVLELSARGSFSLARALDRALDIPRADPLGECANGLRARAVLCSDEDADLDADRVDAQLVVAGEPVPLRRAWKGEGGCTSFKFNSCWTTKRRSSTGERTRQPDMEGEQLARVFESQGPVAERIGGTRRNVQSMCVAHANEVWRGGSPCTILFLSRSRRRFSRSFIISRSPLSTCRRLSSS